MDDSDSDYLDNYDYPYNSEFEELEDEIQTDEVKLQDKITTEPRHQHVPQTLEIVDIPSVIQTFFDANNKIQKLTQTQQILMYTNLIKLLKTNNNLKLNVCT